jgi:hypothetical protein
MSSDDSAIDKAFPDPEPLVGGPADEFDRTPIW